MIYRNDFRKVCKIHRI